MKDEIELRDDRWLEQRLQTIRKVHFSDVSGGYPIDIRFGIRARYRFGSIAARSGRTIILMNRLFADPVVPAYVVDSTIGHEMAHYAHGFGSGLPQLYTDPHRGGVVDRELERRGLAEVTRLSEEWRKANWETLYNSRCGDLQARRDQRDEASSELWRTVLCSPKARGEDYLRTRLHTVLKQAGAAAGSPVFEVGWLEATIRQAGTSYWFHKAGILRLHGLLSDPRVPEEVIDFELAYWVYRHRVGGNWPAIHAAIKRGGFEKTADSALRWRRASWTAFRRRNHPLS